MKFSLYAVIVIQRNEKAIYLSDINSETSCQFIFLPEQIAKNFPKKGMSVEDYIYNSSTKGELLKCKTILDNTFQYIANTAETLGSPSELDLGLDEALIYAYIMTHTNLSDHFFIRFFNWEYIDKDQIGFKKEKFKNKSLDEILTIFNISESFNEDCWYAKDYIMIPALTSQGGLGSNHISSLIITKQANGSGMCMYSFDTMGGKNKSGSHLNIGFFDQVSVKILQEKPLQGKSGCGFYTSYFFEESLSKNYFIEIVENQEGNYRVNEYIIEAIRNKFNNLLGARERYLLTPKETGVGEKKGKVKERKEHKVLVMKQTAQQKKGYQ